MVLDFPLSVVAAPLLSFFISFFSILWLVRRKAGWVLDYPNSRSLHSVPVSRIGGLGLLFGVITAWLCFSVVIPITIWAGIGLQDAWRKSVLMQVILWSQPYIKQGEF